MSLSLETRANDQDTAVEMRWLHDSEDEALTQKDVDDAAALTRHVAVEGSARALLERVQKDAAKRFQRRTAGVTLLIGAVLCEASYAVIGQALTGQLSPRRISALINLWGFALSTPFGVWLAWRFDFGAVSAGTWGLLVGYALAACMWTVWLWMTGLKSVPAAQAGVFTVLLPISAAAVGVLVLGERLGPAQWAAYGVAQRGVVLATLP